MLVSFSSFQWAAANIKVQDCSNHQSLNVFNSVPGVGAGDTKNEMPHRHRYIPDTRTCILSELNKKERAYDSLTSCFQL